MLRRPGLSSRLKRQPNLRARKGSLIVCATAKRYRLRIPPYPLQAIAIHPMDIIHFRILAIAGIQETIRMMLADNTVALMHPFHKAPTGEASPCR
jgi:hypothetical protein